MNVTFHCAHCDQTCYVDIDPQQCPTGGSQRLICAGCHAETPFQRPAPAEGQLAGCLICPSAELYVRKDFPQSLGVAIVMAGILISSIFWAYRMPYSTYGVLFATALIDVVLYLTVGNVLQCYRCQTQYRDLPGLENHGGFDLETHEKHRQQRLRLAEPLKPLP